MARVDLEAFARDGFVLLDVLNAEELVELRAQLESLIRTGNALERPPQFFASDFQHLGDRLEDYGKLSKHYYFHLLTDPRTLPMQHVFHHRELLAGIEQILGPQLIINNASLFAAEPGTTYKLGWHRDVIQIPQHLIDAQAIYNPRRFHNNVQSNLPCYADSALWVVPGSHVRPRAGAHQHPVEFGGRRLQSRQNRQVRYQSAAASAREALACLETAEALGWVQPLEPELGALFHRVIGTLVRLIAPRR
jgi:hypothetical protein